MHIYERAIIYCQKIYLAILGLQDIFRHGKIYFGCIFKICLLKFNVSFRHCYEHIGDRHKPGAGRQSPTLFDRFQGVL